MDFSILDHAALPIEPPTVCADLPGVLGRIGEEPPDFCVDEIPAYLPSGNGDHLYVRVQKSGLTTPELVHLLSRAAEVPEREIGHAGLKDKHAITSQWLSLPARCRPVREWELPANVVILEESRHSNKLRTGHLRANRFRIRLVDVHSESAVRLQALVARLSKGMFNAFGIQRFGHQGRNLSDALAFLRGGARLSPKKARLLSKLLPSVLQSELFNRYLWLRQARDPGQLIRGEVVRLQGSGSNFVVEDLAEEQPRYAAGDLHPQGPMFGPKMRAAAYDAEELERTVLRQSGLDDATLSELGRHAPGTRRDLLVVPEGLSATTLGDSAVMVEFTLPAGGYATQVVRELTKSPWFPASLPSSSPLPPETPSGSEGTETSDLG